jgi:hypothetical protein
MNLVQQLVVNISHKKKKCLIVNGWWKCLTIPYSWHQSKLTLTYTTLARIIADHTAIILLVFKKVFSCGQNHYLRVRVDMYFYVSFN